MSRKARSARRQAVLYSICAILCFFDIGRMFPFLIIFVLLIAFSIRTFSKYANAEENPLFYEEKLISKITGNSDKTKSIYSRREIREKKKLYEKDYQARLKQIEEDFSDDIFDENE